MTGTRQLQNIPVTAISRVLIYRKHTHTNIRNQFSTNYRRSDGNAGTARYDVDLRLRCQERSTFVWRPHYNARTMKVWSGGSDNYHRRGING